jgi:hypothetical protein
MSNPFNKQIHFSSRRSGALYSVEAIKHEDGTSIRIHKYGGCTGVHCGSNYVCGYTDEITWHELADITTDTAEALAQNPNLYYQWH